ncbi:formimidoylglutamate deiminase [Brevibacterium sp. LS14]|uniref:Cytosine deaminase n=1 Tax=Brevibacterium casei S18 TaxID=1229781 RepID=K9B1J7_9MICO|nr:formimidoylglutamate deiminase [Brevibacterium casei]EKU47665.1 cytosine deaminase [Brevibacterium casei S18]NJE66851.1 formimidoylglutamate deiminase [Brevibacterium sp. LS14]
MTRFWCESAWVDGAVATGVLLTADETGTLTAVDTGIAEAPADAEVIRGLTLPGGVNAHSHAFHRILRGRTHGDGGTFWTWREVMYSVAGRLSPESYETVARAVFAEMLAGGYTSVGEFHYVHHAPGGTPYPEAHAMERALARAAASAGIRIRLLDTCYLTGGIGTELSDEQARFGDGTIEGYLDRHTRLEADFATEFPVDTAGNSFVTVGAAIHSVRAVPAADLPRFAEITGPLHVHLSEQPAENEASIAAYGTTPTLVLARAGVVTERLSPVHATHLSDADIATLGEGATTIVMCPCTEADLADGIGPARELAEAGATIALGSDQHVVLDALRETQGLEAGERLRSGERGRFSPAELIDALTRGGARSLDLPVGELAVGKACDFIAVRTDSMRTVGSLDEQAVLSATAADIHSTVSGGVVRVRDGVHTALGSIAELYAEAFAALDMDPGRPASSLSAPDASAAS